MAIKKILEAIFEQDFMDSSYGFRPNLSCHDALKKIDKTHRPINKAIYHRILKSRDAAQQRLQSKSNPGTHK